MDNQENLQDFDLDALLNEFLEAPDETGDADLGNVALDDDLSDLLNSIDAPEAAPAEEPAEAAPAPISLPTEAPDAAAEEVADVPAAAAVQETAPEAEPETAPNFTDTIVALPPLEKDASEDTPEVSAPSDEGTIRLEDLSALTTENSAVETAGENTEGAPAAAESAAPAEEAPVPPPIPFTSRSRLQELKRKLIAGPEKRYYDLSEKGVGKIQIAILLNLLVLLLCIAATTMFTMGMVPENRLRLVIFSQVLAMLVSATLGSQQMLDGISEILHAKFSVNSLLFFTFLACCADAVFCLKELRVPCCACFTLEMTFALLARYHRRSTEMAQMDTLRKAVKLRSIVVEPNLYNGKPGILRGEGDLEDFMDTYGVSSNPKKLQSVYAFICLIASLGIAAFAGLLHTPSLAVQILSTSLLVSVPASFFVSLTRPAALLERRLHMVGSLICGWQGVKKLSEKAIFPLRDEDLFPRGSTKLNGVKFYGSREPEEVLSYTTSLISEAGGSLVPVFRNMLTNRGGKEYPVTEFRDYGSGGIGGIVCGEPVLMGSLNFLQDMGIEIPQGTMVNQAVYAAIDGELCAVIAISYAKMHYAAAGLVSLCGYRKLTPVMVTNDFMLTDEYIHSKFSVNTRRIQFPEKEIRTSIRQKYANPEASVLALATRDDLASSVYAITGAGALRTASNLGMAIHMFGGIIGLLIMLALAYIGSTDLLTPTHVLLYQLVWMIPGLLVTEWTRAV